MIGLVKLHNVVMGYEDLLMFVIEWVGTEGRCGQLVVSLFKQLILKLCGYLKNTGGKWRKICCILR